MLGKIVSGFLMLVLVWAMKFGCNMVGIEMADDTEWITEENAWIAEEIQGGQAQPAQEWLQLPNRATYEADVDELKRLVDDFDVAGASGLWVAGLEEYEGVHYAGYLAVELPAEGPDRKRIFDVEESYWEGSGTADVGQEYLVIPLD